jgi:CheY-like chemotaxis protein
LKRKILILEDDSVNQELLRLYLDEEFDTFIVTSIEEGMEALGKQQYDLIISDIHLGNASSKGGIDFLKEVRANRNTSGIPIVAYTAFNNPNERSDVKFTTFIAKPITKADFLKTVKKILAEA